MADSRPNIILIITDQQRYDTIAALGYPYMETPHLDRLAHEGTVFTNCFITAPSCAPSRASLFTGYYPHTTGIYKNADRWRHSWVETLAESGYYCVNIGKMHTYPYDTPLGFHERYVVENKDRYLEERYYFDEWDKALQARGLVKQQRELYRRRDDYAEALGAFDWELPEDLQSDMFVGNFASWWLASKPKFDQPLFLEIGFPGPHPPYDPTPRFSAPYMDKELPTPVVTDEDLANQPPPLKAMRVHNSNVDHDSVVHLLNPTPEQSHRQRAYYYANVTMIDEQVGKIMSSLEKKGYLDNALVIFTSDHGDCLGDHGHSQKWTMYDIITRVPLIVWRSQQREFRQVEGLCQLMDLGPTILDAAGVTPPAGWEARSLQPALAGDAWTARDAVFAEHGRDGILQETEFMTMIRTESWKLVHFLGEPFGQLFHLADDPDELVNLWDDPAAAGVKAGLLNRILEWRIAGGVRTKEWSREWR